MKKGKLFKVACTLMATALVATSVLVYVDKKSAKASNNVTKGVNTIDNQVNTAMDSFDEVSEKGNTKVYKMKINGSKVTYKVTETATGRKVVQTNDSNNEYTELVLNNDTMSVATGEIVDGKYVAKKSDSCNVEELSKKAKKEEEQATTSNRVSCLGLAKSLWYEKEATNVNVGKSRFGSDLEKYAINLDDLSKDDLKTVENYQNYVDKSSKCFQKAKKNLKNSLIITVAAVPILLAHFVLATVVGFSTMNPALSAVVIGVGILVYLALGLAETISTCKLVINSVKTIYNGFKAEQAYKKVVALGIAY